MKPIFLSTATAIALVLSAPSFAQSDDVAPTGAGDCTVSAGAPLPEGCTIEEATDGAVEGLEGEGIAETFADDMGEADMDGEAEMTADADAGEVDMDADVAADAGTDTETDSDLATGEMIADASQHMDGEGDLVGMTVSEIVGMDVHTGNDNDVGEIDYIIRAENGYEAVIGIGGFLGLGEYTVALPLDTFALDAENDNRLIINGVSEEELEAMPEIDESELNALEGDYVIG